MPIATTQSTLWWFRLTVRSSVKAIVSARITNDPEHQAVGKAARGLVFFGTPHQGSDYGAIGDVLSSIVRVVRRETSNDIMKSLKRGSKSIDTLTEDFSHHQERFRVVTFCETLPTASHIKGPRMMVRQSTVNPSHHACA
jgi:hypothetical protein